MQSFYKLTPRAQMMIDGKQVYDVHIPVLFTPGYRMSQAKVFQCSAGLTRIAEEIGTGVTYRCVLCASRLRGVMSPDETQDSASLLLLSGEANTRLYGIAFLGHYRSKAKQAKQPLCYACFCRIKKNKWIVSPDMVVSFDTFPNPHSFLTPGMYLRWVKAPIWRFSSHMVRR